MSLLQYKQESDGDVHLVMQDSAGHKMIAELPYSPCVPASSRWQAVIAAARASITHTCTPSTSWRYVRRTVTLKGLALFDPPHGQSGAAGKGIELHSVRRHIPLTRPRPRSAPFGFPQLTPPTDGGALAPLFRFTDCEWGERTALGVPQPGPVPPSGDGRGAVSCAQPGNDRGVDSTSTGPAAVAASARAAPATSSW